MVCRALGQFGRDDHPRSLRLRPPPRDLFLGQARPGHPRGGGQARGSGCDAGLRPHRTRTPKGNTPCTDMHAVPSPMGSLRLQGDAAACASHCLLPLVNHCRLPFACCYPCAAWSAASAAMTPSISAAPASPSCRGRVAPAFAARCRYQMKPFPSAEPAATSHQRRPQPMPACCICRRSINCWSATNSIRIWLPDACLRS
ncbi:hypothetical protein D3C71_835780 [compost metagenome]